MSRAERLLSYSILSLITSKPLASAPMTTAEEGEDEISPSTDEGKGTLNTDGAWCWREGCTGCLKLTKSMQKTADALQSVADIYDDHARRTQLITHEALKGVSHPYTTYAPVLDTHASTVTRYHEALASSSEEHEDICARCETVLNTTMAEMETYHSQKVEDFESLTKEHLDGEIQLYQQILSKLKGARGNFDEPFYGSLAQTPRQPSIFERELENPRLTNPPLTQPTPHVFDSAPMRPVSVAIQEGVGLFLNAPRSSVFGKFW